MKKIGSCCSRKTLKRKTRNAGGGRRYIAPAVPGRAPAADVGILGHAQAIRPALPRLELVQALASLNMLGRRRASRGQ